MAGESALREDWRAHPEWLVPIVARGLRAFHEALPVDECPFRFTAADAAAHARRYLDVRRATWGDQHQEHQHLAIDDALDQLVATAPVHEDLVVCHGDYCYPNMFIEDGVVTGYLDLGELGVADRWWDIAIGMWSTTWNVGPGYEELFADSYGVDVDTDKLAYYRLQYDLVS
jgi:kanamycin kinase